MYGCQVPCLGLSIRRPLDSRRSPSSVKCGTGERDGAGFPRGDIRARQAYASRRSAFDGTDGRRLARSQLHACRVVASRVTPTEEGYEIADSMRVAEREQPVCNAAFTNMDAVVVPRAAQAAAQNLTTPVAPDPIWTPVQILRRRFREEVGGRHGAFARPTSIFAWRKMVAPKPRAALAADVRMQRDWACARDWTTFGGAAARTGSASAGAGKQNLVAPKGQHDG